MFKGRKDRSYGAVLAKSIKALLSFLYSTYEKRRKLYSASAENGSHVTISAAGVGCVAEHESPGWKTKDSRMCGSPC